MPPIRTILALTATQWAELSEAHALLTSITAAHAPMCLCELCRACALTSTVDPEWRVVTALIEE